MFTIDLSTYSRFIHDHTKRQMEAQGHHSLDRTSSGGDGKSTTSSRGFTNGSSTPTDYHS
ncbi:hypothetical protein GMORB2_3323 [Geosmithia morbida]|uniref:Uncharacterized protein n=1 Tax=Geosmithia morbida TaxID=1094350 RepID=A0A9P5D188_9HYPO|nr:uncharacterized protein GMORB2_3323 [Geosmithia morbida]KAF4120196.1 hypothetical protein GMORB2_3323 [Geosmithia morbida]